MYLRCFGDCHGRMSDYIRLTEAADKRFNNEVITVVNGDLGIGMPDKYGRKLQYPALDKRHMLISGNHSDPVATVNHSNYIGSRFNPPRMYGHLEEYGIYFCDGAWSPDWKMRTLGIDWWPNEQMSYSELLVVAEDFAATKPKIMITHDCPSSVSKQCFNVEAKSNTSIALQMMFEKFQPQIWMFGHWHCPVDKIINGTRFICIPELEKFDLDLDTL